MGGGDVIITIIFLLIVVASGLKKLFQSAAAAGQAQAPRKPDFEASPTEVEDFLRSLQKARTQQGQAHAAPPRGGRARPRADVEVAGPLRGGSPRSPAFTAGEAACTSRVRRSQ